MATYLVAQYLLIHGLIEGNKKGKTKRDWFSFNIFLLNFNSKTKMLTRNIKILALFVLGTVSTFGNHDLEITSKPLLMMFMFWVYKNNIIENDNKDGRFFVY